ncbi:MAG: hypothetical protein WD045_11080 [Pirellulaceae bacterium]
MLLRSLVTHWIQQQARTTLQETLSQRANESVSAEEATSQPISLVVQFALGIESAGLHDLLEGRVRAHLGELPVVVGNLGPVRVACVDGGVGRIKALAATERILTHIKPAMLISAGFAGGLVSGLRKGNVVVADEVLNEAEDRFPLTLPGPRDQLAAAKGVHVGRLLTVDRIIREPAEKKQLGERLEAIAVDMETFAVAKVCAQHETPLLSIRIISDSVDQPLPRHLERLVQQKTTSRMLGAAAAAIFNKPSSIKEMFDLHGTAVKASDSLASFLAGIIPQLELPESSEG